MSTNASYGCFVFFLNKG